MVCEGWSCRTFLMNLLQVEAHPALSLSRPAILKASAYTILPKIMPQTILWMASRRYMYSKYSADQTGEAYLLL